MKRRLELLKQNICFFGGSYVDYLKGSNIIEWKFFGQYFFRVIIESCGLEGVKVVIYVGS